MTRFLFGMERFTVNHSSMGNNRGCTYSNILLGSGFGSCGRTRSFYNADHFGHTMLCWPNHRCITSNFELFWHFCGEKIIFLIEPFPRFIINHSFALFITLPWIKFSKDPCHVVRHPTGSPQYRVAMKILRRLWKKLYLSTTLGLDPGQPKTNWLNNAMKIGVLFTPCSNWIQFQAALP